MQRPRPARSTFTYDAAGRLVPGGRAAAEWIDPITVTYTYDGDGNRISRSVGGVTTQYVWDPNASVPLLVLELSSGRRPAALLQR